MFASEIKTKVMDLLYYQTSAKMNVLIKDAEAVMVTSLF